MSQEVYVFVKKSRVPALSAWQGAVDDSGLGIWLDKTFRPLDDSGFIPCSYRGHATGFEFSLGSIGDVVETYPELRQKTACFDTSAIFVWGGDLNGCVCAMSSAAILTQLSDGLMYDPQEDQQFTGPEAIVQVKKLIEEVR